MTTQFEIKNWFDNTYSKRGESYLRPKEAYTIFLKLLEVQKGKKILDVACGLGRLLTQAHNFGLETYGIDISSIAIKKAKLILPHSHLVEGNAEQLPFTDSSFDYVTCLGSLERMLDRNKVLSEIHRVLHINGKLCLMVRNAESWKWKFIKKPFGLVNKTGHQDALKFDEWAAYLNNNGFEIISTVCDQWPTMKSKRLLSLGLWKQFDEVQSSILPLRYANEFIFICKKVDH